MIARFNRIFADIGSGFPARKYPVSGLDIAAAIAIGCLAVVEMIWAMGIVGDSVWKVTSFNLWFEADTPRVIANLTDSASNQYRSTVHPMAAAMLTLPVVMLEKLGLSTGMAARTFMAFISLPRRDYASWCCGCSIFPASPPSSSPPYFLRARVLSTGHPCRS